MKTDPVKVISTYLTGKMKRSIRPSQLIWTTQNGSGMKSHVSEVEKKLHDFHEMILPLKYIRFSNSNSTHIKRKGSDMQMIQYECQCITQR